MRKKNLFYITYFLICLLVLFVSGCKKPVAIKETRLLMGTAVSVEIITGAPETQPEIVEKLWAEAERLEKIFSLYITESEISRINREAGRHPVSVSREMMEVLQRAEEIGRITGGAFDISIGPLMRIWGFFPEREGRIPTSLEIEKIMAQVGWRLIELDRSAETILLLKPGMEIDLGALAKGYVVDKLVKILRQEGIRRALVNAGGDIFCLGDSPGGQDWKIGMEHPRDEGDILKVFKVKNRAIATSGDYRNYFIRSNLRYSHIIDPHTGFPSNSKVVEVSVMAPDCMTADALATAMFVMGAEKGIELLNTLEEVEGIIVTEEEDKIILHCTDQLIE